MDRVFPVIETPTERAPPPVPELSPATAFALMLETGCEEFEVLQFLVAKKIRVSFDEPNDARRKITFMRARHCITMSLAKSFVAHVIRARRICEHGAQHLRVDRIARRQFLSATKSLVSVRDINEHGFDVTKNESTPTLHLNGGGLLDETSLFIGGPDQILMGPLNLCHVYRSAARMRELAGFASVNQTRCSAP